MHSTGLTGAAAITVDIVVSVISPEEKQGWKEQQPASFPSCAQRKIAQRITPRPPSTSYF